MICAPDKAFIFNRNGKHNVKHTLHFVGDVKHTSHLTLRDVTYL